MADPGRQDDTWSVDWHSLRFQNYSMLLVQVRVMMTSFVPPYSLHTVY
jgi:hypothetical protein